MTIPNSKEQAYIALKSPLEILAYTDGSGIHKEIRSPCLYNGLFPLALSL